jgi:prepilin peptidase CpaA
MSLISIIALVVAASAAAIDLRTRRIPNLLTFGAAACAIAFHTVASGLSGGGYALAGWLVGTVIFFPVFALRGMGAGDVKLVAALGAWLGPLGALYVAAGSAIAGGLIALVVMLHARYLGTAYKNVLLLLTHWRVAGIRPLATMTLAGSRGPRLAYAVPILIGTMGAIWLR